MSYCHDFPSHKHWSTQCALKSRAKERESGVEGGGGSRWGQEREYRVGCVCGVGVGVGVRSGTTVQGGVCGGGCGGGAGKRVRGGFFNSTTCT